MLPGSRLNVQVYSFILIPCAMMKSVGGLTLNVVLLLFHLFLPADCVSSEGDSSDEDDDEIDPGMSGLAHFDECGVAVNLGLRRSVVIQSPDYKHQFYGDELECKYYIYGTARCIPNIICDVISMRKSEDCAEEHVKISDAVGGEIIFCQNNSATGFVYQASKGYRDLYVTFKTGKTEDLGSSTGHRGFKCTLTCGKPGKITEKVLPPGDGGKKEIPCACGIQNKNDRVVGGEDVEMNEFPWQVALVVVGTRKPFCGGSLLNDRFILSAAHCFNSKDMEPLIEGLLHARVLDFKLNEAGRKIGGEKAKTLALGETGSIQGAGWNVSKQTDETEKSIRVKIARIIKHPLFSMSNFDFDCALLEIEQPLNLKNQDAPTPICLPPMGIMSNKYTGVTATVVGWGKGHEKAGSNNRLLQKLDIPVLNIIDCNITIPYPLTRRMLCAGFIGGGKDACTGDSGGPLIFKSKGVFRQIGIVSWGEGCAQVGRPGLYSRVTEFNEWIAHEANAAGAKWCKGLS